MLEDGTDQRQQELAQLLYALDQGIGELRRVLHISPPDQFIAGVPRLYSSCMLFAQSATNAIACLTFHHPLPCENLPLYATLSPLPPTSPSSPTSLLPARTPAQLSLIVKLVKEYYGEDVHWILACYGFAPALHGYSWLKGAPTAYVIEHLRPNWMSLFDFGRSADAAAFKDTLWATLQKVVAVMGVLKTLYMVTYDPTTLCCRRQSWRWSTSIGLGSWEGCTGVLSRAAS
ncbi:hypothetical protein BKA93DRAFT_206568 [Sparassis latifolia]